MAIARNGVWSFHHGSDLTNRGGPAGVWEVLEGSAVTGVILQVLTEELDNGRVLCRSFTSTDRGSATRNRAKLYRNAVPLLLRQLRRLHEEGFERLGGEEESAGWTAYTDRLYVTPRTREVAAFLGRRLRGALRNRLLGWRHLDQWALTYCFHDVDVDDPHAPHQTLYRLKTLLPPKDRFWADPFPVWHEGRHYVFFEELLYAADRGHISMLELGRGGVIASPVRVLERPYHLSYPLVFHWQGHHYMVPETSQNRTVELYRAVRFPHEWRLEKVLIEHVNAVDATPFEHDGRWWMYLSLATPSGSCADELCLYHAESPLGPWMPHPRNPVVTDVRRARPAGRPFRWRGALHRLGQSAALRYGEGIVVHRVDRLDVAGYRETPVGRLTPNWRPDFIGMHTLNADTGLTVGDAIVRRSRYW